VSSVAVAVAEALGEARGEVAPEIIRAAIGVGGLVDVARGMATLQQGPRGERGAKGEPGPAGRDAEASAPSDADVTFERQGGRIKRLLVEPDDGGPVMEVVPTYSGNEIVSARVSFSGN
jgi:hypothetical protein